jgi:hypothetical protein
MQIYTRKELEKWLKANFKPNDPLFAFIITKDEVEASYDGVEFTNRQFIEACESVNTEGEEQIISEEIHSNLAQYVDENENANA